MGEKTQVETDELRTWAGGARDRSDRMNQAADDAGRTDVGLDVFGPIHRVFCGDYVDKLQHVLDRIRDTARNLATDSDDARASADTFDQVDQTQADRFGSTDGHH
jgi:hypothetical protein